MPDSFDLQPETRDSNEADPFRSASTPPRQPIARRELILTAPFCVAIPASLSAATQESVEATTDPNPVFARRAAADAALRQRLSQLADRCDQLKLPEQAKASREWFIPRDPKRTYLFLPAQSEVETDAEEEKDPDESTPAANDRLRIIAAWSKHFQAARREQADRLVKLAVEAIDAGFPDAAYQWLHEALHEDPDHKIARAALDYRVVNGRWRLPGGSPRASTVRLANRRYRFSAGRHYRIESEHFRLLTDDSKKAGLEAVEQLEVVYALWRQAFFPFWGDAEQLKKKIQDPSAAPRRARRKFAVVLFQDRQKYVETLSPSQPLIDKTVGIYMDELQTAFFYSGDDATLPTRRHEAAHQFFSESAGPTKNVGLRHNFWVVEAIALYMESLRAQDRFFTLGGLDANRTQYARYRAYNEHFYAPLSDLTGFSRQQLQTHDELRRLYSQSAGLAGYFMNRGGPERRIRFLNYVRDVYRNRDNDKSLQQHLDAELKAVDRQYLLSLMVDDQDARLWPKAELENLAIGHTLITDAGLAEILPQPKLTWLDLAATKISDVSAPRIGLCDNLEQLNLEATKVTDAALPHLAKCSRLIELDLSGCEITSAGLVPLTALQNLQVLWLTDTQVDDAGLQRLRSLKQLRQLHVNGSAVTAAGLKQLQAALPNLQREE